MRRLPVQRAQHHIQPLSLRGKERHLVGIVANVGRHQRARGSQVAGGEGAHSWSSSSSSSAVAARIRVVLLVRAGASTSRGGDGAREEVVEVGADRRIAARGQPPCGGQLEPVEQGLGVAARLLGGGDVGVGIGVSGFFGRGRHAEDLGAEQLDGVLEVGHACGFHFVVGGGDQVFDLGLVVFEVGVHVGRVYDAGALCLRENEVEEEEEADVRVEGNPAGESVSGIREMTNVTEEMMRTTRGTTLSSSQRGERRRGRPSTSAMASAGPGRRS